MELFFKIIIYFYITSSFQGSLLISFLSLQFEHALTWVSTCNENDPSLWFALIIHLIRYLLLHFLPLSLPLQNKAPSVFPDLTAWCSYEPFS